MESLWERLREREKQRVAGQATRPVEHNRTYHLCMDERMLSAFTRLWMSRYKPCPFTMRDAAHNVKDCIVVSITDKDGQTLGFIAEALALTQAKLAVK